MSNRVTRAKRELDRLNGQLAILKTARQVGAFFFVTGLLSIPLVVFIAATFGYEWGPLGIYSGVGVLGGAAAWVFGYYNTYHADYSIPLSQKLVKAQDEYDAATDAEVSSFEAGK